MTDARAAVFHGPGRPLEVVPVRVDAPGPGDVVVRLRAVGVCGSDLHVIRGEWPRPVPMILGHEGAGEVEAVGHEVTRVAPGDHVVVSWNPACGVCASCRGGRPTACLPLRDGIAAGTLPDGRTGFAATDGSPIYRMTAVGAFATHVLMPERAVLPIPSELPFEEAALLGCAALTGVGAALHRPPPRDGTAVVLGAGGVGLFALQGARAAGATRVVVVDPNRDRLALARELGATATYVPEEAADQLGDGADIAYECVGSPATVNAALALVRPGGTVVVTGLPASGERYDIDPAEIVHREKTLTGSIYGSGDPAEELPALLERVARGEIVLQPIVREVHQLEDIEGAVTASLAGTPGRVVVEL